MQERTPGPIGALSSDRPESAHGITITSVKLPAGNPLQASCLCGWESPIVASRPKAIEVGAVHTAEVTKSSQERVAAPLAVWQTEPCPSWCAERHGNDDHAGDRDHWSQAREIPVRMEKAIAYARGGWGLAHVRAYLRQHWTGGDAWIHLVLDEMGTHGEGLQGIDLRFEESMALSEALDALYDATVSDR